MNIEVYRCSLVYVYIIYARPVDDDSLQECLFAIDMCIHICSEEEIYTYIRAFRESREINLFAFI